ncbi:hypothetical protein MYX84_10045 [Acidobacteria bacterium AH-259-O06]|nr:hypothetical protein [Acidobacteria bacterium AH-259-O06]
MTQFIPLIRESRFRKLSHPTFLAVVVLLAATLALFGDVLFSSKQIVLAQLGTDVFLLFSHWRDFGFGQLQQGNLALWNPHIFSGMPHFGDFQSALLYPLNWFYLILPLSKAINFGIASHVFLSGLFMYFWTSHRGLHPAACLLSSLLFMFCGPHLLHIYAGHLTIVSCVPWIPMLFLVLDAYSRTSSVPWLLLGMLTIAMQILAGYPQYVFITAVAAGIYTLLRLFHTANRRQIVFGLAAIYLGGAVLSAVQLLAGLQAASEGIRGGGVSYAFASSLSFPPENFVTLFVPGFFGNMTDFPYWGRWYLWEMCLFVSVTGLILAVYGATFGEPKVRCFSVTMVVVLCFLALGAYTPFFKLLYTWVPGFNLFRSPSKFMALASLFIAMLSGIGLDTLLKKEAYSGKRLCRVLFVIGLLVGSLSLWIYGSAQEGAGGAWGNLVQTIASTKEMYIPATTYQDPVFVKSAGIFAAKNLFTCCATFLLLSLLFFLADSSRKALYLVALLAVAEILIFAGTSRATFDLESARFPPLEKFLKNDPGDYRVLVQEVPNVAMSIGAQNIWGCNPVVLRRYAEFMTFTQGQDPDKATQYLQFTHPHRLYDMLRCRYLFIRDGDRVQVHSIPNIMPRLQLVQDWVVITDRDQIFAALEDPAFDPREKVILETPWVPVPVKSDSKGTAHIVDSSTDYLIIEASLPSPAILLITDNYSEGWRAMALSGSDQDQYDLLPANYILKAVPLKAGNHRIRVEYLPKAFLLGKWISIVSLLIYVAVAGVGAVSF